MKNLLTVYARKVASIEDPKRFDVAIYSTPSGKLIDRKCVFPYFYKSCPTKRNKFVTINCYRWNLEWVA